MTDTNPLPPTSKPTSRWRRRLPAVVFLLIGLLLLAYFGSRSVRSFNEIRYAREQGLNTGQASVSAIRPWMTVRYIAVAYAVPEEYIFAGLNIRYDRRNQHATLGELNKEPPLNGAELPIVGEVQAIILAYRENPVATGLDDIRPWMTLRYIANSTGVPESYLLQALGLPDDGENVFKPLGQLDEEYRLGGPRLMDNIQKALMQYANET